MDACVIEVPSPVSLPEHGTSLSNGNDLDVRWDEILPSDSDDVMEYDAQNTTACSFKGDTPGVDASMQTAPPINSFARRLEAQPKPEVHILYGNRKKQHPSRLPTFFVTPKQLHRSSYSSVEEMQQADALLPATVTPRPSPVTIDLEADDYELNLAATAENLNIPAESLFNQYLVVAKHQWTSLSIKLNYL